MGTEILKSFGTLQSELEQARSSLKGVDENIKRLIGRDPSELPLQRQGLKRPPVVEENRAPRQRGLPGNRRVFNHENNEPPVKRRGSVFNRLSDRVPERPSHYEEEFDNNKLHRQMISKVIVTPKEVPSRQEALEAQSKDERSKARNRRMFGSLLGTLQKFQQEETKLKSKEEKRAQVEKKIEEIEIREKAEIKRERKELFFNRKKKQAEIKMIELKMNRMKEYAQWEELQKPRMCFISTKAKPHIHYLPHRLNEANKTMLNESKTDIEKLIDQKRQEAFEDLQQIEERMKRNFEPKLDKQINEKEEPEEEEEMEDAVYTRGATEEDWPAPPTPAEPVEVMPIVEPEPAPVEPMEVSVTEEPSETVMSEVVHSDIPEEVQPAAEKTVDDKVVTEEQPVPPELD